VLAISGGLAEMPFPLDITYYTRLPTPTIMYGCFSEAMVLAMAGRYESYSIGQGRITQEKMANILALAQTYGFQPAPLFRGKNPITDETLSAFLQHSHQLKEVW
jgi:fatty aldehyde-generating acyl-ACP reductase